MNKSGHPEVSDQKLKCFNYCIFFKRCMNKVMDGHFEDCHGQTQSPNR